MDAERRLQIARLYHEAKQRPGEDRSAFLEDACGGDATLRQEVEELLAADRLGPVAQTPGGVPSTDSGATSIKTLAIPPGAPTMLGSYRLEGLLGRGGMGSVFLAYDTTLRRHVALKTIDSVPGEDDARSRLLREARSAAALNHPSICTIHEVGVANGTAFIAMEYVEGRSLRDRLDEGPLEWPEAVRHGIQAADALAYAHERGVIHRDFKAANVMITRSRQLKLVDFGLARRDDVRMEEGTMMVSVVPPGGVAGTPYAMAPEQVRGETANARTDIWALGVLMYEMVSPTPPFLGRTAPELLSAVLRDPPRPVPSHVPVRLRRVIERCLEKDAERRFQNASEVRASLEAIQQAALGRQTSRRLSGSKARVAIAVILVAAVSAFALNMAGVRDRVFGTPFGSGPIRLAVLPLENRGRDPEQEYLSAGLTAGLTTALSRVRSPRLSVITTASSSDAARPGKTVEEIAHEVDANVILKGNVVRSENRVRVVAELDRMPGARKFWSRSYDRAANDLYSLEQEISSTVLGPLRIVEASPERKTRRAVNPEAYELYLRGLSHALRINEPDIDLAIDLLERSVALDPTFVPAQAYLAFAYSNKAAVFQPGDPQWEEKGFAAVQKAIALDPEAPEAHYAQAMMLWRPSHGFPSREALQELSKALTTRPNFDEALHWHGVILYHVGHLEAALREIQRALEINPGNTLARFRLGPIYIYQQRFDDAIALLDRVPPEAFSVQWTYQRAWALMSLNRLVEADRMLATALQDNPTDQGGVLHAARAMLRAKRGDRKGAEADIAEAVRVGSHFMHFHHTAYSIGATYATLGRLDQAQEWIEKAADDGFPNYAYFEKDVNLAPLRATPRFREFLSKLRAEWEHIPGEPD